MIFVIITSQQRIRAVAGYLSLPIMKKQHRVIEFFMFKS